MLRSPGGWRIYNKTQTKKQWKLEIFWKIFNFQKRPFRGKKEALENKRNSEAEGQKFACLGKKSIEL